MGRVFRQSVNAFRISGNENNAVSRVSCFENTPGHSGNTPETLKTGEWHPHPYDTLLCHIEDNPPPTAAAIVALCLVGGAAVAFGLALWVLV